MGNILMDVERPAGEGRAHNLTAFNDPRMKAFIRAMNAVEDQGLLPSPDEVAALSASRPIVVAVAPGDAGGRAVEDRAPRAERMRRERRCGSEATASSGMRSQAEA